MTHMLRASRRAARARRMTATWRLAVATVFEVRDEIWEVVEPMIPPVKVPERQGRRPVPDRVCYEAIVFVMITGIAWGHLPSSLAAQE